MGVIGMEGLGLKMKVRELIEILQKFDSEMIVVNTYASDYRDLEPDQISKIQVVEKSEYHERYYENQYTEKPDGLIEVVHFDGN